MPIEFIGMIGTRQISELDGQELQSRAVPYMLLMFANLLKHMKMVALIACWLVMAQLAPIA